METFRDLQKKKIEVLGPQFSSLQNLENIDIHVEGHHRQYFKNLSAYADSSYEQLQNSEDKKIVNNCNQLLFHNFFWQSLTPKKKNTPSVIQEAFQGKFEEVFLQKALTLFGSGWCWIVQNEKIEIVTTSNAEMPSGNPLLVLDLWEHAYYLSFTSKRALFVENFLKFWINWETFENNLRL